MSNFTYRAHDNLGCGAAHGWSPVIRHEPSKREYWTGYAKNTQYGARMAARDALRKMLSGNTLAVIGYRPFNFKGREGTEGWMDRDPSDEMRADKEKDR